MEMLVAMAIFSIVGTILMSGYFFFFKNFKTSSQKSEDVTELFLSYNLLKKDIQNADEILYKNDRQFACIGIDNKQETIYYKSSKGLVRERNGKKDTLNLKAIEISGSFLEKPQNEANGLIDELNMRLIVKNDTVEVAFNKWYAADKLIKWQ